MTAEHPAQPSKEEKEKRVRELRATTAAQIKLAEKFFPGLTQEEQMRRWGEEGYSKTFRDLIDSISDPDPTYIKRQQRLQEGVHAGDDSVIEEIYQLIKDHSK